MSPIVPQKYLLPPTEQEGCLGPPPDPRWLPGAWWLLSPCTTLNCAGVGLRDGSGNLCCRLYLQDFAPAAVSYSVKFFLPTVSWAWSAGNSLLWGQAQGNLRSYCLSPKGCPYLLIQFSFVASTYVSSYRVQVIQPNPFSAYCERTRMIPWLPLVSIS